MKKVLITGGAGYIGDAAVEYLLRGGHEVTVFDNLIYGGAYMRRHDSLRFIRGDIRHKALVDYWIEQSDAVLHLAAIVGDGACAVNPTETIEVNETATKQIAETCAKLNKRMVFASTCSVYGANNDTLTEDSPTNPLSVYATTKLRAEEFVRKVPEHFICRLGTLFGLGAEHARLRCDLVVNILTYKACSGQKITVFGGEQWRPLLHVRDAGNLMSHAAINHVDDPGLFGTMILSNSNWRIIDIAKEIGRICMVPNNIEVTDMCFEDQRNYKVSSKWPIPPQMLRTLEEGVREMANVMHEGRIADVWDERFHNAKFTQRKMHD